MSTEIKVSINTGLDDIITNSQNLLTTVEMIAGYFDKMSVWCILNLQPDTWRFSKLITVKDYNSQSMIFGHIIIFDNSEDATAFTLIFKNAEQYVCFD